MPAAARKGDLTEHGGLITGGDSTVIIGNMPAARVGDDHDCPLSEGATAHVGGPVVAPGCATVIIGGEPAARVGDEAACAGPVDKIASGDATVEIG